MSMEIKLQAQIRELKEKLPSDFLSAIVYAPGMENVLIKIKGNDFIKAYNQAGESNLINLEINGGAGYKVLIKEVQKNPIKNFFIHVDFYKVDMDKEINAEIPLSFVGDSRAVKELGALLIKNINEISVECLPSDLIDHIDIDISVFVDFGNIIQIKDINLPKGLKVLNNQDDVVATVVEPREEKESPSVNESEVASKPDKESDAKKPEASK